ncbi:MAG TPA: hypothetical protein VGE92_13320, partial [Steroidobacteraceae bacterium]
MRNGYLHPTPRASGVRGNRTQAALKNGCLFVGLMVATGLAQAQSASAPPAPTDDSLTWHGITLY